MTCRILYFTALIMLGVLFASPIIDAKEVFVAPYGHDSNVGSVDAPLRTIQHALTQSKAGDVIQVREGTYYELVEVRDCQFTAPVTIQSFNKEHVVIDGSKRDPSKSTRAAFVIRDSENIIIQGFEIRNITTDDRDFYPAGILVRGNSKNISIINNEIHHIANTHEKGNAHGILIYGNNPMPISNITIERNKLHHLTVGKSESLTLNGNVDGFKIIGNQLYDNNNIGIDIAGYYGACPEAGCTDYARNGEIAYNTVLRHSSLYNIAYYGKNSSAGVYIDGGKNVLIHHNHIAYNNFGISIASEQEGGSAQNIIVMNNVIVSNDKAGVIIGGSDSDNGGAFNIALKKNHFFHNDRLQEGFHEITFQQNIHNLTLKENKYVIWSFSDIINNNNEDDFTYKSMNEQLYLIPSVSLKR